MTVKTWANGFGIWHARVPAGPHAAHLARHAIKAELAERGDTIIGPLYLKRVEYFDAVPGTVVYAERDI